MDGNNSAMKKRRKKMGKREKEAKKFGFKYEHFGCIEPESEKGGMNFFEFFSIFRLILL